MIAVIEQRRPIRDTSMIRMDNFTCIIACLPISIQFTAYSPVKYRLQLSTLVNDAKYFVNNSSKRISGVLVVVGARLPPPCCDPKSGFHTFHNILWMCPTLIGKKTPTCNGLNMKGKRPCHPFILIKIRNQLR